MFPATTVECYVLFSRTERSRYRLSWLEVDQEVAVALNHFGRERFYGYAHDCLSNDYCNTVVGGIIKARFHVSQKHDFHLHCVERHGYCRLLISITSAMS